MGYNCVRIVALIMIYGKEKDCFLHCNGLLLRL